MFLSNTATVALALHDKEYDWKRFTFGEATLPYG
jgi:hypothetical protein